jgi:pimeloyl-ACP methyl ester carboxylesterase
MTVIALVALGLWGAAAAQEIASGMARVAAPAIFWEAAGSGPPVVLIHGGQMDRRMWDPQFLPYAKSFRVIRYDVRNYGRSASATLPYSDVDDLGSLLDELQVGKAHLVGLSLGGRIALEFTVAHPDRVASLVAVAPGLPGFPNEDEDESRWPAMLRAAQEKGGEAAAELWLTDPFMIPAMENPALAPRLRQLALENGRAWLANPYLPIRPDPPVGKRLRDIRAPTLVVVGDRDIPHMQRIADKLAAEVPGAKKVVIAGAGHISNMEKPAEFDAAVLPFLKAQPAAK